jgi:flagellar hook protein FlgE
MSFDSIKTAGSSMKNIQQAVDIVSHNIANVNTTGYKQKRVNFESVVSNYVETKYSGTSINSTSIDFAQGRIKQTGTWTDLSLQGDGFFVLQDPTGSLVYTRSGHFTTDSQGNFVNSDGFFVLSSGGSRIQIPMNTKTVEINSAGEINIVLNGTEEFYVSDQIGVANFVNPKSLESLGGTNYRETVNSGYPEFSSALGLGTSLASTIILSGTLETSNADLSGAFSDMISFQRSYQAVSKTAETANEILQTTLNLA